MAQKVGVNIKNRKASYDYEFIDDYDAGIKLLGTEVKAIRLGLVNISAAYCYIHNGEVFVRNMSVHNIDVKRTHDENREKKLLLNRGEIDRLERDLDKGKTIVVRCLFERNGMIKMGISLAKGKKDYDKRNAIKERDLDREKRRNDD